MKGHRLGRPDRLTKMIAGRNTFRKEETPFELPDCIFNGGQGRGGQIQERGRRIPLGIQFGLPRTIVQCSTALPTNGKIRSFTTRSAMQDGSSRTLSRLHTLDWRWGGRWDRSGSLSLVKRQMPKRWTHDL
jgi:hypothetical protein